jgi:hypothetical protein
MHAALFRESESRETPEELRHKFRHHVWSPSISALVLSKYSFTFVKDNPHVHAYTFPHDFGSQAIV